jgi:putative SOS response-associated peptidase YedK
MCGRFVGNFAVDDLLAELAEAGVNASPAEGLPARVSNFNTAPTHDSLIVTSGETGPVLQVARWGLLPPWSKDPAAASKMINARSETVTEKPSFRNLVSSHRAMIPMTGFYEWDRTDTRNKRPFFVPRADGRTMWAAGLWVHSPLLGCDTFTLITRESLADLASIHHRSPVQLDAVDCAHWALDVVAPLGLLALDTQPLLAPYEVDKAVNSVRNTGPGLVEPKSAPDPGPDTLF